MLVQEPVHSAIWHCLNHYAYEDATFLAERLFTEVSTDESLFLLATCYFRNGRIYQAYDILRKHDSNLPENRFLLAKCCLQLEKIHEAEIALINDVLDIKPKDICDDVVSNFGDIACFALQTLAKIFEKTERGPRANEADRKALKLNPMLWNSFEKLCQRGDFIDPSNVFATEKIEDFDQCSGSNHVIKFANKVCHQQQIAKDQQTIGASSNLPQPRQSLLATPFYPSRGSSTSTPILPISSVQSLQQPAPTIPQPVLFVTPLADQQPSSAGGFSSIDDSDSCFSSASPALHHAPNQLTMSGIGMLSFNSDITDKSVLMDTSTAVTSRQGGAMLPPPIKPKIPLSRIGTGPFPLNEMGAPPTSTHESSEERTFGRFPRGLLLLSSDGKPENVSAVNNSNLVGSRLDFSPLGVLSPHVSTTPLGNVQTPKQGPSNEQIPAAVPLINATNSDHKMKRTPSHNENSTPLKQSLFGQSSQNQNTPANNNVGGGNVRRSSRLFGSSQQQSIKAKENANKATNTGGQNVSPKGAGKGFKSPSKKSSKSGRPHSGRHPSTPSNVTDTEMNEKNKLMDVEPPSILTESRLQDGDSALEGKVKDLQKYCLEGLMTLFRQLGRAYLSLARYQCRDAIENFDNIDSKHRNTAWVMGSIGKAYFEMGDYLQARKHFQQMRDLDPHRREFTEYFSTTLWHLQEEVELSALAQEMTSTDKLSPQTWCAAGNCFSLQKEHENAIKFFQRASQVDPSFAYAYTLLGHEYITIEELDKALTCFRTATRIDPRHYNAWYGIGLVFYKQERYLLAEMNYKKTVEINPQSPVLMCHLAVVQHALQKTDKALETLSIALSKAPQNPLCKFERASILFSIERFDEALVELNQLKILVPKESPVYFLMGKVHNKLNNTHMALMHFSWAMDLDPKGANSQIKDALDRSMNKAAQESNDALATHVTPTSNSSVTANSAAANSGDPLLEDEDEDEEMLQDASGIV